MITNISEEAKKEITAILELYEAKFGGNVQHLINELNGMKGYATIEKQLREELEHIQEATNMTMAVLASDKRYRPIVVARQFAMYAVYNNFTSKGYSLKMVGDLFNRDHATVMYSIKTIRTYIEVADPLVMGILNRYNEIKQQKLAA